MVLFKINGERNSGTNFLMSILKQNGFNVYDQKVQNNICSHWKHGIPRNDFKLLDDKVVDIFVFRPLEEWLLSMHHNYYHLKQIHDFGRFLTIPQESNESRLLDYETNKCLNADDNNKTIFEIRYYKFNKIIEYKKNNDFIIFVNMLFLQDENNLLGFLDKLNSICMNKYIDKKYNTQLPHTKIKQIGVQNRKYNIDVDEYKDIINKHKNVEIETFINNLTVEYWKCPSSPIEVERVK